MNEPKPAERTALIKKPDLRRYSALVQEMGGVNLSQGVCDYPAPDCVKQAAIRAIEDDLSIYTDMRGATLLRETIAAKMQNQHGLTIDPETQVVVTSGSTLAFSCAMLATLNPGDEVVTFSPVYRYYKDTFALIGVNTRFVDTHAPDFAYDPAEFEAAFTDRTRMVLLNSPANPHGRVLREEELLHIARVAKKHNCWILSDEIYDEFTYGVPHVSIASLDDAKDRTIILNGPSKVFAVTGWRVGYMVGPAAIMEKIAIINDMLVICAPSPLQYAVAVGMRDTPAEYYEQLRQEYRIRRDMLADALAESGFIPHVQDGAIYIMAEAPQEKFPTALDATERMIYETGVAAVPATNTWSNPDDGIRMIRFCFGKSIPDLEEACRRLRKWKM